MPINKRWKVVGGTVAAAVALGGTAAVAQPGTEAPEIDLDDVVTIDQVTPATVASLVDDTATITLEESVVSAEDAETESPPSVPSEETASPETTETATVETVSPPSAETAESTVSVATAASTVSPD